MQQSEDIKELATALSKAQAEIEGAVKDSKNPFFKSNYADLSSVISAIKEPLAKYGLSVSQMTDFNDDGIEFVETQIMHSSGQWLRGRLPIKAKDNSPQAQGSGISYVRRYALQAALCVSSLDDDGQSAQHNQTHKYIVPESKPIQYAPVKEPQKSIVSDKPKDIVKPSPSLSVLEYPTTAQKGKVQHLIVKLGKDKDPTYLRSKSIELFNCEPTKMSSKQADDLIKNLEQTFRDLAKTNA